MNSFQELKNEYKKVFFLEDGGCIDLAVATVLSTYMKGDPIWTMIVGPSSGGKSELVNVFGSLEWVHPISDMT